MRHRVAGRKLKRSASHRRSLLRSLSTELIRHKRITTTEAKAKEASRFVEGLISKARRAWNAEQSGGEMNLHARRIVGRDIQDKGVLRELFSTVAEKVAERPGGYTRVIRIGQRNGDGAEMAVLELVDYNLERDDTAVRSRSKNLMSRAERVRRSQEKQKKEAATEDEVAVVEPVVEEEEIVEVVEEAETAAEIEAEEVVEETEVEAAPEAPVEEEAPAAETSEEEVAGEAPTEEAADDKGEGEENKEEGA